jgi:diaminohydroxyphosphoribosylaminopyrimidine deaminase/5-amino-6-(5-phosphoribosylamino)uracil reductase
MPHAEVEAIRDAGAAALGADLYVTLEPCSHTGRTGPCTEAVLAAGIRRVAAAMPDPNPLVSGKGIAFLRRRGITVVTGLLESPAREINRGYCRWIVSGKPFVTLKLAVSMDGQIAPFTGVSRWISGERSRKAVHRMRSEADAVLVGAETVRRDDPLLSSRVPGGKDPRRVVLAARLSGLAGRRLFREGDGEVLVVCPRGVPARDVDRIVSRGGRVIGLPARRGRIDAEAVLAALGKEGIASLLVEGGGRIAGWLASAGAIDRLVLFVAPVLLGEGVRSVAGFRPPSVVEGMKLAIKDVRRVGEDLMVTAEPAGERER